MKCPTFDAIYNDTRLAPQWDPWSEKRYYTYDTYLNIWEDGVVTLTSDFDRNTDRSLFGKRLNIEVLTSDEYDIAEVSLITPCGVALKKVDLSVGGATMLLIDHDHNIAVPVGANFRQQPRDRGVNETVRWPMRGAQPLTSAQIVARVFDRDKQKWLRPYMAELLAVANAALRMTPQTGGYPVPAKTFGRYRPILEAQHPVHEALDHMTQLAYGGDRYGALFALVQYLKNPPKELFRRRLTCKYLKVVRKGGKS